MQAHASHNLPYPGDPIQEAQKLACHERFVMARSRLPSGIDQATDLFAGVR